MKSLLKKILSKRLVVKVGRRIALTKALLSSLLRKTRFTSALYYLLFDHQYYREQQATLVGKQTYRSNEGIALNSSALLRRNTHRLEKGLIMQPRKAVFAESYIIETVNCLSQCLHQNFIEPAELKWAQDVLSNYFEIVTLSPIIEKAKEIFELLPLADAESTISSIPYVYSERECSTINSQSLHQLFKQRRSVRWYQDKTVDIKIIEQAVEMASQAPSACNRQPFQFYTFTDPKRASEIASIPMGTKGFSDNIQALIVIVGDLSAYPKERDRHVIYIDGGLVAMQLMLAFESLGLSTCPINWPDMELYEQQMDKALALEKYQRPIMLMAVGYGKKDGGIPFSQKKTAEQLIKEID
jgi:nitroreductase